MLQALQKYFSAADLAKFAATARQVLELQIQPAPADLPLTASRIGGTGYWPQDRPYPQGANGQPLALLAQFNLAELPHHPDLPESGMLAFYIDPFDFGYGINFEDPYDTSNYRSIYFADTATPSLSRQAQRAHFSDNALADADASAHGTELKQMPGEDGEGAKAWQDSGEWYYPINGEFSVQAKLATHYLLFDSTEFEAHFHMCAQDWLRSSLAESDPHVDESEREQQKDAMHRVFGTQNECHLLGYPMFSQQDPRYDHHATDILLFQLASSVDTDIAWGDFGVGQFFIAKADLQQRRFENAWLHWDGS